MTGQPPVTSTSVTRKGLGATASRGAAFTMGGQAVRLVVQLVGVVVLARLLTPADYGLVAMVVAITGVGEIFRDFGLSSAAIQAKQLSPEQKDNLFWINTGIGVLLAVLALAAAPLIAGLYNEPRLALLASVLSVTFVLNGLSTQYRASMSRGLRYGGLAGIDVTAQATGLAFAIALALAGAGYWALAAQQIGVAAVALLGLVLATRWVPGPYRRAAPMRRLLGFGSNLVGAQLLGYASKNIDQVLIGTRFGASATGLYNRAFQLLMLPLNQINAPSTTVALPVLSKLQDERDRYRDFLLTGQTVLLHVVLAVFSLGCALAAPLIVLVLGPQWLDAVPIFQILSLAGVFQSAGYAVYWVFLSKGLTRSFFHWQLISAPGSILIIVIGSLWGVHGVAWGYSVASAIMWALSLAWIRRVSDAPVARMFLNGVRVIVGYSVAGLACFAAMTTASPLVASMSDGNPPLQAGILPVAAGVAAWLAALGLVCLAWPAFRHDFAVIGRAVKLLRSPKERHPHTH